MDQPLVASSFDLTGSYLASSIVSLDSHKLRIQSIDPSSTNVLSNSFTLDKGLQIQHLKLINLETQFLSISLNNGNVLIYSPVQNDIIATLKSPFGVGIVYFHYSRITSTGFSIDLNGNIIEWDIINFIQIRNFKLEFNDNNEPLSTLTTIIFKNKVHLLVGSYNVYLVDLTKPTEILINFPGHISTIHTLLKLANHDLFLTSAGGDRFINIYSLTTKKIENVLVAQSNVASISFDEFNKNQLLTVVTEDGLIEVFKNPLATDKNIISNNNSPSKIISKKARIRTTSKNSDLQIKIQRPLNNNPLNEKLSINLSLVLKNKLIFTWLEDSNIPFFEKITWFEDNQFKISQDLILNKLKPSNLKISEHSLFGHDIASAKHYNEGNAIIQSGDNFKDLELSEDEDEKTLAEKLESLPLSLQPQQQQNERSKKHQQRASTGTLTVILTQALKSNDHALLESVLGNKDETLIKRTIAKLSNEYVIPLLNRLSERIARNSNKQSVLNIWIKWLLVICGGFLSTYPNLTKNLNVLHSTLHRRSLTLNRLLELNGKIDMVLENLEIKKSIFKIDNGEFIASGDDANEDEEEDDVEYIEELDNNGILEDDYQDDSDLDMDDLQDDYVELEGESEEEEDEEDDELKQQIATISDEEDNYSDVEVDTNKQKINKDLDSEEEEEKALRRKINSLKSKKKIASK
ncbi:hypothetical protein PACTADRAFT_45762 [Pachysolen tannophilus NRRL Y-2460]|uniref:Small-subunit processome Utp12 domain-containing protein n=1 Tax=Pachysolen tannophilus NRRL Y-2460 TaxID=669874 RepID=A0A1E4TPT9_PACTA|nr:hypothetical protein PACTADRAFT_45762 [Pachysolen tannophilus NRRL Y-2460]